MAKFYISKTPLRFPYVLQSTDYGKVIVASSTGNVETANVTLQQLQTIATNAGGTIATTVSSVAVTDAAGVVLDDLALGDTSYLTVYGENFRAGALVLVGTTAASSTTGISGEELRASFAGSNVAPGTYNVTVLNTNGTSAIKQNAVTFSPFPAWNTTGVLSATTKTRAFSRNLALATPGDSAVSYSLQNGTLPPGTTLTGGTLAGNITENPASTTVYSFTLKAEDAELQGAPKTFTLNTGFLKNFSGNANVIITTDGTFSTTTNHLAVSNSGGFVKLVGSGFLANASVLLANAALSNTTFVSSTELRAQIPSASEGTVSSLEIVNTDGSLYTNGTLARWAPPAWSTPAGQLGAAIYKSDSFSRTVAATHGAGSVTFAAVSGFPAGVAVDSSGVISGAWPGGAANEMVTLVLNAVASTLQNATREFTLSLLAKMFAFTSHTFTNAGVVGYNGPSLAQARAAYTTTWDETYLNMTTNGIQVWTVPQTGTYRITAKGGCGGDFVYTPDTSYSGTGGLGRVVQSTYTLTMNSTVFILVGQNGGGVATIYGNRGCAGGGGSFVVVDNTLLLAAGGGGGATLGTVGQNGVAGTSGGAGLEQGFGAGGTDGGGGGGGNNATGGAGYTGNGGNAFSNPGTVANSFVNNGRGSFPTSLLHGTEKDGGFGGGGFGGTGGGGGGGYSGGGAGGYNSNNGRGGRGGGGGSYSSTTMTNFGVLAGNGYVTIEFIP